MSKQGYKLKQVRKTVIKKTNNEYKILQTDLSSIFPAKITEESGYLYICEKLFLILFSRKIVNSPKNPVNIPLTIL